jgi:Secretion system C-terminal sorting domain
MKTKILLLLFSFIGFSMFSQSPTLTMLNSGPQPGDVFHSIYADTTGVGFGSPGANQIWDYSNLVLGITTLDEFFLNVDLNLIPNSTVSCFTEGFLNYLKINASEYSMLAFKDYRGIPIYMQAPTMIYSVPLRLFTYPFNFSDNFTDLVTGTQSFIVITYRKGTSSTMADGYGTLLLPTGTFNNVLRVKNIQDLRDSTVMMNPPGYSFMSTHNEMYLWYDGIHKTPVLKIRKSTKTKNDTTLYTKSILVAEGLNRIKNGHECDITFDLYPNPAVDRTNLAFSFNKRIEADFSILNLTGKEVLNVKAEWYDTGEHTRSIDVSQLPRGLYIIKCETPSGNVFRKMFLN